MLSLQPQDACHTAVACCLSKQNIHSGTNASSPSCLQFCLRYAEDKRRAREQYEAIGKLLDAQVASNNQRNAEEAAQQQQEIDVLKARWAADDEAARQEELAARAKQQQLNLEVKEFNRCFSHRTQHPWKFVRSVQGCFVLPGHLSLGIMRPPHWSGLSTLCKACWGIQLCLYASSFTCTWHTPPSHPPPPPNHF